MIWPWQYPKRYAALEADRDNLKRLCTDRYVMIIELREQLEESQQENARLLSRMQFRVSAHVAHQDGCHGCNGEFECQQCNRRVGNCLGCADEHYALCDECAGQEVTKS